MQVMWDEFLKIIEVEAGAQVVETWFKAVTLDRWDPATKTCVLRMPNTFVRTWVQDHYKDLVVRHLSRLLNVTQMHLFFVSNEQEQPSAPRITPAAVLHKQALLIPSALTPAVAPLQRPAQIAPKQRNKFHLIGQARNREVYGRLNESFTFDTFVVGPSNALAHAASVAVSRDLGSVYNPLFIYGGTGLGKTHLLHAIGNAAKLQNPDLEVAYISSDHFMNEFISSIRGGRVTKFREKYQKVDLLMLDDIQFFSKKEQTQEIFFHIFNSLFERKKQVVFSSDALPDDIDRLQERLRSRLKSGLIADVQLPRMEMKLAILNKKATQSGIELAQDVASFLALQPVTSIRELEGLLIRISASSSLMNVELSLELAKNVVSSSQERSKEDVTHMAIMKVVSQQFAVSIDDLKSPKRTKTIAHARQVIFYLMKKMTMSSLSAIGTSLGGRDHSTVLHAIGKIENLQKQDATLATQIKTLEHAILRQR